jgi:hypothetical protein
VIALLVQLFKRESVSLAGNANAGENPVNVVHETGESVRFAEFANEDLVHICLGQHWCSKCARFKPTLLAAGQYFHPIALLLEGAYSVLAEPC